jgi:hypothetical protein
MAEVEGTKFGSTKWFLAWGERLANAGMEALTNTLTAKKTASAPQSDTAKSAGGFSALAGLKWLPYALAGAAVLVLALVFRKKG